MLPFLCFRCLQVSNSAEGLRCPRCDGDGSGTVTAASSYSAIPECGNASPGYYVTVEDASTQVSEEDLVPVEPTREASTQVSEEDLLPVEPTREASTQVSEEDLLPVEPTREASTQTSDDDLPLQIAGSTGSEYCLKSDGPTNTNEGVFPNEPYEECNAANLLEVMEDKPAASKQTYICKQSSVGEGGNENSSDVFLERQGPMEPIEREIKCNSFAFTDSITLESNYTVKNLLSDSTEKVEDRQNKENIPQLFSFCPQENPFMNKCFQENSLNAISVAQQTPLTSNKLTKIRCDKCRKYFFKESTFYAHLPNYCNQRKFKECRECGAKFTDITCLLKHQRVHTEEKPFKCTQCGYASKWQPDLKKHLETHTNIPPSISSFSRRNSSVNKSFQKKLVTSKTLKRKNPQSSNKFKIMRCKKCTRYFRKLSTFIAHARSNCNPRPYKCIQCDERFPNMCRLIEHRRVHTAEKPFKCTQCDYSTKYPSYLKKHLETHH